jgi:RNA-directed DNA polymerase
MRAERGNPVRVRSRRLGAAGKPTVRKAGFPGGNRTPKKRMPAAERQRESGSVCTGPPGGCSSYNRPDTGLGARLRKQADVRRVSLCRQVPETPEPRGKLDAMTVNGTEDVTLEWDAINWRLHEDNVGRLRRRIFKAAKDEDLAKVRSLQKMMLRSWSNTLVSVRQVTQRNTGRKTAGIDGEVVLTAPARMVLAVRVHRSIRTWDPLPVKRVYVPKANARLRPLGIPVIMDRCHQSRAKNALEPEWEARFEARSYGFRPGRSCQDAIEAIYDTCKGRGAARVWTLDADLAAAFDKLDHSHLMSAIGFFPGRGLIRGWLTAGVFEPGKGFAPTEEGSPQGGVISPLLLNVALHGLEEAAGVRYGPDGIRTAKDSPVLVRYADLCRARHKSAYAEARVMPRWPADALASAVKGFMLSA